jgi:8-oxo-dGTP diphosphatase
MIGVDFATLSPLKPTSGHAASTPLGWQRFGELCATASFPVYALGGMHQNDVAFARLHGAQGIAGISAFWPLSLP